MADLTYRSPKTEVRPSPIHGQGLFARTAITAGEIVAVKGGHVLTGAQWASLEPALGAADIQIAEDLFIAPVRSDDRPGSMLYTNHSCDPTRSSPSTGPPPTTAITRWPVAAAARAAVAP